MKKILSLLIVVIVSVTFVSSSYAAVGWEKVKGGAKRLAKSPLQLKENVVTEYGAAKFKPFGIIGGAFKGLFYTGKEAVTGLVEIITFPVDDKK